MITLSSQKAMSDSLNELSKDLDKMSGSSTEEVLEKEVDVEFGEYSIKKDKYTTTAKLSVKVTNKTSETKSFSIQMEAIEPNGTRITNDYIYANNLGARQSQSFDIFNAFTEESANKLKNATFKIVEVSAY